MRFLCIPLLLLAACGEKPPAAPDRTLTKGDMDRFLFLSVLEGLMEDRADHELIGKMHDARGSLFVGKCPICTPVSEALSTYLQASSFGGSGFPPAIEEDLRSKDRKTRLAGIQKLVERYVTAGFARRRMSEGEQAQLRALLAEGKEFGMTCAKALSFEGPCPSCEGAGRAKP